MKIATSFLFLMCSFAVFAVDIEDITYSLFSSEEGFQLIKINHTSASIDTIGILAEVEFLQSSVCSFDKVNEEFYVLSNLGVTAIDVEDASITSYPTPDLMLLEYYAGNAYSLIWEDTGLALYKVNMATGEQENLGLIQGVTSYTTSSSSFDYHQSRFIFRSNLGITFVNVNDPSDVSYYSDIPETNNYEYHNYKLYCLGWVEEVLTFFSLDLETAEVEIIGPAPFNGGVYTGLSSFNEGSGHFMVFPPNQGLTAIDINDASDVYGNLELPQNISFIESLQISPKIVDPKPTSINDLETNPFSIYPNPTVGALNIQSDQESKEYLNVIITNLKGETIHNKRYQSDEIKNIMIDQEAGIYLLEIQSNNLSQTYKIVKQ